MRKELKISRRFAPIGDSLCSSRGNRSDMMNERKEGKRRKRRIKDEPK